MPGPDSDQTSEDATLEERLAYAEKAAAYWWAQFHESDFRRTKEMVVPGWNPDHSKYERPKQTPDAIELFLKELDKLKAAKADLSDALFQCSAAVEDAGDFDAKRAVAAVRRITQAAIAKAEGKEVPAEAEE